jgi:hypothetical protein
MAHRVFILFLLAIGALAAISVGVRGCGYYTTPVSERAFRSDYEEMKPSSPYSIGLGSIGAAMVTVGVAMYSLRKRMRALWNLGNLSSWLEFHIFLCLLGPTLVVYHTTFKAGGVAAISLWSMLAVAGSGIVGRFLYILIPRNIKGTELTASEIQEKLSVLSQRLEADGGVGHELVQTIDARFASIKPPDSISGFLSTLIRLRSAKRSIRYTIRTILRTKTISPGQAQVMERLAKERAALLQKTLILTQTGRLFYYWHAIHLPFTVIMFITLILHVVVVTMLGYTWSF